MRTTNRLNRRACNHERAL